MFTKIYLGIMTHENWLGESHTLLTGAMNLFLCFPHVFFNLCEICYKRSAHNAVENCLVSWKLAQGKPYILMGMNEIEFVCTVKPYDILKIKNALVKPLYCAVGYTICSVVFLTQFFKY
jgi:hypothetical protein